MSDANLADDDDFFDGRALQEVRAAAERYRDHGWKLVRLRQGTKMAFDKGWPTKDPTPDSFSHGLNLGVRFGPESGGLVDVDLDFPEARALVGYEAFGLSHLMEFGRTSLPAGQRGHRLAIVPDAPNRSRVFGLRSNAAKRAVAGKAEKQTVVEIRGANGSQTAFPPLIIGGLDGDDPLIWSNTDGEAADFPALTWAELNLRVGRLAFCAFAAAIYPEQHELRLPFCLHFYGALREAGVGNEAAQGMIEAVAFVSGDKENRRDAGIFHKEENLVSFLDLTDLQAMVHTLRSWLGLAADVRDTGPDMDPGGPEAGASPVGEENNDNASARISPAQLEQLLAVLDPADYSGHHDWRNLVYACHQGTGGSKAAARILCPWCKRIPRPKEKGGGFYDNANARDELAKLWKSAGDRTGGITVGTLLAAVKEAGGGSVVGQILKSSVFEDFAEEFETGQWNASGERQPDAEEGGDLEKPHRFRLYSIAELGNLPPLEWLIHGLVVEQGLSLIYGPTKQFKTFIAIALCIATGRDFYGLPVKRGRVVYVIGEGQSDFYNRGWPGAFVTKSNYQSLKAGSML